MKKILGILLVLMIAFSLFANGGKEAAVTDEAIKVSIAYPEIVNATFAPGESMEDNLWTRLYKEKFNIEVETAWVSIEYDTKLNLAIASNDLPDLFRCNLVQFEQLAAGKMLADITDAYETNASASMRKMMNNNADIFETVKKGGKLYGIPQLHYGYETSTPHLWMRKDWLEKSGITDADVSSVDDYEAIMDSFMNDYGAEFGIMLERDLFNFYLAAPMFHAYPEIWVKGPKGDIVYGATLPEMKTMLAKFAEWYQEGYIRKDFAMLESQAMFEDAYNGKVGTYFQHNWAGWQVGKDMVTNQNPDAYFVSMPMPSIDNQKTYYSITFPNTNNNVASAKSKHPEVLITLINNYIDVLDDSINAGTMTVEEVLPFNTNDMHHVTGPAKVMFQHYYDIQEVNAAIKTRNEKFSTGNAYLFYTEIMKYINNGDLTSLGRYIQMGYDKSSLVRAIEHIDGDHLMKSELWGLQPEALLDYGSTLNDLLKEGYTQIIMGLEPVDYYDALIEKWKTAGGAEVTAAVNEMYGK
jgi:putative aldouronate transport system substrate-binding protein